MERHGNEVIIEWLVAAMHPNHQPSFLDVLAELARNEIVARYVQLYNAKKPKSVSTLRRWLSVCANDFLYEIALSGQKNYAYEVLELEA